MALSIDVTIRPVIMTTPRSNQMLKRSRRLSIISDTMRKGVISERTTGNHQINSQQHDEQEIQSGTRRSETSQGTARTGRIKWDRLSVTRALFLPAPLYAGKSGEVRVAVSLSRSLSIWCAVMKCSSPACHRSASRRARQMPSPFVMKMLCIDLSYATKLCREGPFLNLRRAALPRPWRYH